MIGRMFFAIRQGFRNVGRNHLFSLASIGTITACLFIFGIFYCIVANFNYMIDKAQTNVGITVFFDTSMTEEQILQMKDAIDLRPEVEHSEYTSADEAWEDFKEQYFPDGDEGILAGLDNDNPLYDCANLTVYLADTSRQSDLIAYIEGLDGVSEINSSGIIADSVTDFSRLISYVSMGIILILALVAIFLISNTVMIDEIAIMKYIGATDVFVRGPFIIEGMTIGLIGSVIPVVILRLLYTRVVDFTLTHFTILRNVLTFMDVSDIFRILIPVSLAAGLGIGFLGSYLTLRKHVRV